MVIKPMFIRNIRQPREKYFFTSERKKTEKNGMHSAGRCVIMPAGGGRVNNPFGLWYKYLNKNKKFWGKSDINRYRFDHDAILFTLGNKKESNQTVLHFHQAWRSVCVRVWWLQVSHLSASCWYFLALLLLFFQPHVHIVSPDIDSDLIVHWLLSALFNFSASLFRHLNSNPCAKWTVSKCLLPSCCQRDVVRAFDGHRHHQIRVAFLFFYTWAAIHPSVRRNLHIDFLACMSGHQNIVYMLPFMSV